MQGGTERLWIPARESRAVLSGAGSRRYYGSAQMQQTVTGTGRVERLGG